MWKKWAKQFNLAENYTSMVLGFIVVVILGVFVFNVFKRGTVTPEQTGNVEVPGTTTEEQTATPSGTKEHTVAKGETLWKISEQYYKSGYNWSDIAKANNLTNPDKIEEGQKLTIPNVKPILPETGVSGTEEAKATESAPATPEKYTVVRGDTLWSIAVKVYQNGYRWVDIAKANNLTDPNVIHADNVLTLPK